jgi:DNA-binding beta-propeller fold protein YncE
MFKKNITTIALLSIALFIGGCGSSGTTSTSKTPTTTNEGEPNNTTSTPQAKIGAFFGDPLLERSLVIDMEQMELIKEIPSAGENTYNVEIMDSNGSTGKIYTMTRGSYSFDVIDAKTLETTTTIPLAHFPRSGAYNAVLGLMLISGKNKPMSSLIDVKTDQVIKIIGKNEQTSPSDYGGSNATGHPFWMTDSKYVLINRAKRTIQLFKVKKVDEQWHSYPLWEIQTPTSVHHLLRGGDILGMNGGITSETEETDTFYAVTEGSHQDGIAPSIIEIKLNLNKIAIEREVSIGFDANVEKGTHHAAFHPTLPYIYLPSKEGKLYVIDTVGMKLITTIETGKGSGHVCFVPKRNLAMVTNHHDTYVTIIDTNTHTKVKNIKVSGESINDTILQSHTQYLDEAQDHIYAFASDNGIFYELDLETLEISRTLDTGGTPKQGGVMTIYQ